MSPPRRAPREAGASPHDRVVDASVAVKLLVPEPLSDRAQALLDRATADPLTGLAVPDFLYAECANVLWKYIRRFGYPTNRAMGDIVRLLDLSLEAFPTSGLAEDALDIAIFRSGSRRSAPTTPATSRSHGGWASRS